MFLWEIAMHRISISGHFVLVFEQVLYKRIKLRFCSYVARDVYFKFPLLSPFQRNIFILVKKEYYSEDGEESFFLREAAATTTAKTSKEETYFP